ncbi:MAG: hypothetical protein CFE62_003755 [Candidatus Aquirickettsiella gammari]|uniref:Uncharacterized protein n=1 Tax=Candidatus Aquirickettsiella gammari TaxID=2016198 RepID=A0A370CJ64_9COXI|nr:MAG: hypothetical protein CFE62_003755 [Candidatus Aquirickettsiella gammari]
MSNAIKIVSHNPSWQQIFYEDSKSILNFLKNDVTLIHHTSELKVLYLAMQKCITKWTISFYMIGKRLLIDSLSD